jgi:acyl dehydratase
MNDAMLYYEDLEPGAGLVSPPHVIDRGELVAFAREWDPLPFHIDEAAGAAAFGSLTAPGLYMLAIKQRLVHRLPPLAVIASMGYDEVRFLSPLRPGDTVTLKATWVERRPSSSKPDRGVVTIRFALITEAGIPVLSHLDTILVRRRSAAS